MASFGDIFQVVWNMTVSILNITNFILFVILSRGYDVNKMLRDNVFIDSYTMMNYYWYAQLFDSLLVLMNIVNIIQFTTISRRVSLLFKLIGITAPYLFYLVLSYLLMLVLMGMIVWQVWGDRLSYFRNVSISSMYTLALFDLKSMYLGKDFMSANQFGVSSNWLFVLIVLFAVVLHYSLTLQYSAYFHIYFNISRKYEQRIHTTHKHLKKDDVLRQWLMGITKNPFKDESEDEEEPT
mmetsp:Transcript_5847/g.9389  ORF Transcript_5847/g.9389 Transcript_5847/m.9389 type:complete len:238 (-) Transcript_5847:39-752(-)